MPENARSTKNLINILKHFIILTSLIFAFITAHAQTDSTKIKAEIEDYRAELNKEYSDSATSPLPKEKIANFKGHEFYPVDLKYHIKAKFIRTENEKPFKIQTTGTRTPEYVKYGEAHFELDGKKLVLNLYRNIALSQKEEYKNHLFIPFKDLTSGDETYGGGRYMDSQIPEGKYIFIDFNKAYNPYCAYSSRYSCPIPPKENHLEVEIKAGIKYHGH